MPLSARVSIYFRPSLSRKQREEKEIMSDNFNSTAPLALIVDDDRLVRARLSEHLGIHGFQVAESKTAYEAIQAAAIQRPALILLDGLLPQMHGFEVARMVNALDVSYKPKIVMMTAIYKQIRYRNEARLKYGISDYLVKPIDLRELDQILKLKPLELTEIAS
jgi:DNA-binding response OmpR family regulator